MKRNLFKIGAIAILFALYFLYEMFWAPNGFHGDRFVIVSKGANFSQVADSLQKVGVIRNRLLFTLAGKILGYATRIQFGKYRFRGGMSNKEILLDLRFGYTVEPIIVRVPEGLRATRLARLLVRDLGIDSARFMTLVGDSAFASSLRLDAQTLEGYLMPNTYEFYWQADEKTIIEEMVDEFHRTVGDTLRSKVCSLKSNVNALLTIASIIEGETSIDSERVLVSGVYYNRLKRGMRLQADPTIQYIIGNGPRRLVRSDLETNSAYNTYLHAGLPPGPVNNPGKAAILAALNPKKHSFLYFVANGKGGHRFSKTFAEHEHAVRQYRKWKEEQQEMKKEKQDKIAPSL